MLPQTKPPLIMHPQKRAKIERFAKFSAKKLITDATILSQHLARKFFSFFFLSKFSLHLIAIIVRVIAEIIVIIIIVSPFGRVKVLEVIEVLKVLTCEAF